MTSLVNALAHSLDALFDPNCSTQTRQIALRSATTLFDGLAIEEERPKEWLLQVTKGAALAGLALNSARMALQHKLAHVVGGLTGRHHSQIHCALLPHTLNFNLEPGSTALAELRRSGNVLTLRTRFSGD